MKTLNDFEKERYCKLSFPVLFALTINRTVITTDKKSNVIFSFFVKNAIHEILRELMTIRSVETTMNVVLINESSFVEKNRVDTEASRKKTIIVLK
jgi:hypothetical protein